MEKYEVNGIIINQSGLINTDSSASMVNCNIILSDNVRTKNSYPHKGRNQNNAFRSDWYGN